MSHTNVYPSYLDCVAQALSDSSVPLSMDQLMEVVSSRRPMTKSARSAIYQAIAKLYQAVPLGSGEFGWLDRLLLGNTFRHTLTKTELRRGVIYLDELLHGVFVPDFFQDQRGHTRQVVLDLVQGNEEMLAPVGLDRSTWALRMGPELAKWVDAVGGQPKDDLVIRVDDAMAGRYTMRLQPREIRDEDLLAQRNFEVARAAETFLAHDRKARSAVPVWELVALLIGKGIFRNPVPPDELHYLLTRFSGLQYIDGQGYAMRSAQGAYRGGVGSASRDEGRVSTLFGSDIDELNAIMQNLEGDVDDYLPDWADDDGALDDFDPALFDLSDMDDDDMCLAYQGYLDAFAEADAEGEPLGHDDYHLLEAELESLLSLKVEFSYLLPDQDARVTQLGERLYLDPDAFLDDLFDDFDGDFGGFGGDLDGMDGPPFWQN